MINKILLIAYKFPPYPEVGAFRWAKISKEFADKGIIIHVVSVNWDNTIKQSWHDDVNHENIIIHRIKSGYFHNFKYKRFKNNLTGKILKFIRNQILKLSYLFFYIDEAQHWGKHLIKFCKKIIKDKKIKYVITTGGPYMSNYWASKLKNEMESIKLIHDFRDEWYEDDRFLLKYYKKKNTGFMKYTLNNCDKIITVTQGLKKYFDIKKDNPGITTYVVYNGFDKESVRRLNDTKKDYKIEDFSFIYAGSLSNKRDFVLNIFLDKINENKDKFKNIKIKLFTSNFKPLNKYKTLIKNRNLIIHDLVPQDELFNEISRSFAALHFMPVTQKYIVSVKLFEYGMLKRPVLSLNYGGDTDMIIKRHKLGYSVDISKSQDEILERLIDLYRLWQNIHSYKIEPVDLEEFSYENLSGNYLKIIEG